MEELDIADSSGTRSDAEAIRRRIGILYEPEKESLIMGIADCIESVNLMRASSKYKQRIIDGIKESYLRFRRESREGD